MSVPSCCPRCGAMPSDVGRASACRHCDDTDNRPPPEGEPAAHPRPRPLPGRRTVCYGCLLVSLLACCTATPLALWVGCAFRLTGRIAELRQRVDERATEVLKEQATLDGSQGEARQAALRHQIGLLQAQAADLCDLEIAYEQRALVMPWSDDAARARDCEALARRALESKGAAEGRLAGR